MARFDAATRRDSVPVVEHFFVGQVVAGDGALPTKRQPGEVGRRHHGEHTVHGHRLRRVDSLDAGVRMGTAQHFPAQGPRKRDIGAELRLAGYLFETIVTNWPLAYLSIVVHIA